MSIDAQSLTAIRKQVVPGRSWHNLRQTKLATAKTGSGNATGFCREVQVAALENKTLRPKGRSSPGPVLPWGNQRRQSPPTDNIA